MHLSYGVTTHLDVALDIFAGKLFDRVPYWNGMISPCQSSMMMLFYESS